MRALEWAFAGLAAIGAGYAVSLLALTLTAPPVDPVAVQAPAASDRAVDGAASPPDATSWPPLFGEPVDVPPPPDAEPEPEAPEIALNYRLKGLVAGIEGGWAIVGDGQTDQLLRKGDTVSGGETVVEITPDGVLIEGGGKRRLITFDPLDTPDAPAPDTPQTPAEPAADPPRQVAARPLPPVTLDLTPFVGQRLNSIITRAGGISEIELGDGTRALEILWVRNGLLYDKLGLKKGDKIKTINGQAITAVQNSAELAGALLQTRAFELELIRDGSPWSLRIEVQDAT